MSTTILVLLCLVIVLLIGALLLWLNRGYGPVSDRAYEISSALYSVCNRHDESRIEKLEMLIEENLAAEEISETESDWLTDILQAAKAGKWKTAMRQARRLMQAQSRSAPKPP